MSTRRWLSLAVLPVLLSLSTAAVLLTMQGTLPDPVATHFGPRGRADGFAALGALIWIAVGGQLLLALLLGGLVVWAGRQIAGGRAAHGLPAALVAFLGALIVTTTAVQRGLDDAVDATLPSSALLVALLAALAAGVLGALLAPAASVPQPAASGAPSDAVRAGVQGTAVWHGATRASRLLPMLAAIILLPGVAVAWIAGSAAQLLIPLAIAAVAVALTMRFRVTIGPAGVQVRGLLGWPQTEVPLAQIEHARAEHVRPMAYGGWGWRLWRDRTAIVTAAGEGLVVVRSDGAHLVVTIDRAEQAAGVLNDLLDQREARRAADA